MEKLTTVTANIHPCTFGTWQQTYWNPGAVGIHNRNILRIGERSWIIFPVISNHLMREFLCWLEWFEHFIIWIYENALRKSYARNLGKVKSVMLQLSKFIVSTSDIPTAGLSILITGV